MVTGVGTTIQPQSAGVITSTTNMGTPTVIQGTPATGGVESSVPQRRASDNRRSNKPIMEKRRRARINNCLNDLKTLILDAMKKDPARHSKLEKADILEMTVKHLENLQRQQAAMSAAADPSIINKFRAGFSECVSEVGRFQGLESTIKRRLIQHLANCLQINTNTILTTAPQQQQTQQKEQQNTPLLSAAQSTTVTVQQPSVQLHILPQQEPQNGIFFTNGNGTGVQLVPTRLPNGDIALILPTSITPAQPQRQQYAPQNRSTNTSPVSSNSSSPLPMLIPIPAQQQQQQRPYVIQSVQSSIPSPQDRPSSSTSSMSNASRLSPSRQSSPSYSMPGSPYEIMDTSITSSRKSPMRQPSPYQRPPPQQIVEKPLSLVIRKAPPSPSYQHKLQQEILNEKPWRPW